MYKNTIEYLLIFFPFFLFFAPDIPESSKELTERDLILVYEHPSTHFMQDKLLM